MSRIFISYRREDSAYVVSMLQKRLCMDFGTESVFLDIDNIPLGVDFREHIHRALTNCDIVIAVIGERWEGRGPSQIRKLDNPSDYLRIELEFALSRNIPVIPVLIDGALMPSEASLPPSLSALSYREKADIRPGRDMENDLERLINRLRNRLADFDSIPVTTAADPITTTADPVSTTLDPVTTTAAPVTTAADSVTTTPDPVTTTADPTANSGMDTGVPSEEPAQDEAALQQSASFATTPARQELEFSATMVSSARQIDLRGQIKSLVKCVEQVMILVQESAVFHQPTEVKTRLRLAISELNKLRLLAGQISPTEESDDIQQAEENFATHRLAMLEVIRLLIRWMREFRDENGYQLVAFWRKDSWARWQDFADVPDPFVAEVHRMLNVN